MNQRKIGKYEIREELGRGAMGIVYKAYDTLLNREVALKIMIHAEQGSSDNKKRFYREAQSAGSLMHDNIVKVFDLGDDAGIPYIVMEYLPGVDLKQQMSDGKLTSYRDILKIWLQICNGLHHAHRRGIVHRDIKPGNIRLTTGGRVKIMDFGIAKKPSSDLTQSGVVLGTVDYMAPEQVKGLGADSRSDLFSLGVMFYEIMTLRKPFPGDSVTSVIYKIVYEEPEPLEPLRIACPPDAPAIIRRLLSKDPTTRYATALDVARDLKASFTVWRDGAAGLAHAATTPSLELASPDLHGDSEPTVISSAPVENTLLYDRGSGKTASPDPPTLIKPAYSPATFATPPAPSPAAPPWAPPDGRPSTPRVAQATQPPPSPAMARPAVLAAVVTPPPAPAQPALVVPPSAPPQPPLPAFDPFATVAGHARPPIPQAPRAAMSIDDLPMRPKEDAHLFGGGPFGSHAISHAAPQPDRQATAAHRASATLVDLESLALDAAAPAPRRSTTAPFWIAMAFLFVAVVGGGAAFVKIRAARHPGVDPMPTPGGAAPTPAESPGQPTPPPVAMGMLRIETNIPAAVLVDGQPVGQLPASTPLQVLAGRRRITLKEARFGVSVEREVDVTAAAEANLALPFEGEGMVQLKVRPWANVTIDGRHAKAIEVQAAAKPIPLPAGKHTFLFEQMGRSTTKEDHVVPGKTIEIDVDMGSL